MPDKQVTTHCIVRLVALRGLSAATRAQCQALRQEAGRLWTALVALHAQARVQGRWLSAGALSRRPRAGSMRCTARACRRSARRSPRTWRRPPHSGGRNAPRPDTSRRSIRITSASHPHHIRITSASRQSLPDGGVEGSGADHPPLRPSPLISAHLRSSASAHGRAAATAAAVACGVSDRHSAAGGPLRAVPDAGYRRAPAASSACGGDSGCGFGRGPHRRGDDDAAACAGGVGATVARLQAVA